MFMILIKGMLIIFMLAGIAGILYGIWEIWNTVSFVSSSTGTVKGTFIKYHREISKTTSIRSYSPSNPNMPSTTQSYTVATYPEFSYQTEHGGEAVVRESKVHVFSVYKPGEDVDVLLSSSGSARLGGFYSLYFRDIVILGIGMVALLLALIFWNFALPLVTTPHPVEVYSDSATPGGDSTTVQDSTIVESTFNEIIHEALDFQVGPVKMRHILLVFLGIMVLGVILMIFFGSGRG